MISHTRRINWYRSSRIFILFARRFGICTKIWFSENVQSSEEWKKCLLIDSRYILFPKQVYEVSYLSRKVQGLCKLRVSSSSLHISEKCNTSNIKVRLWYFWKKKNHGWRSLVLLEGYISTCNLQFMQDICHSDKQMMMSFERRLTPLSFEYRNMYLTNIPWIRSTCECLLLRWYEWLVGLVWNSYLAYKIILASPWQVYENTIVIIRR